MGLFEIIMKFGSGGIADVLKLHWDLFRIIQYIELNDKSKRRLPLAGIDPELY